mmetsp:Transcript_8951/g.31172  ORF Transcript_8951/g.31172 Transcript_8951/m.31172 type:complete len:271 (-) Transcript_8951:677-1489(-)
MTLTIASSCAKAALGAATQYASVQTTATPSFSRILDGRVLAQEWLAKIASRVSELTHQRSCRPGLAIVRVGNRPDSLLYVRRKKEACATVGIACRETHLPHTATQSEVVRVIEKVCQDNFVHGVLVQLPLPVHIERSAVMDVIYAHKDVDGFHPINVGRLSTRDRKRPPLFVPCTPKGCMELMSSAGISVKGKAAVILGDSNIVGLPLACMLRDSGAAAVTVCHRGLGKFTSVTDMFPPQGELHIRSQGNLQVPNSLPGMLPRQNSCASN